MEWLLIMFTIYGKQVGEPIWPTMVSLCVSSAKKDKKMPPKKSFQPLPGKKGKFRRAAASYKR